ncbi:hypothetical protein GCM10017781_02170 [Deinococcus metalli]|uniref:Transposase n=1 Tax=Deinococcus metalli TaxID=1141878 RepID=A0ABQ3JG76_9DEIO|nr:hypothetical protein GCM10017781_02170 [Deinococcus metalli]
MVTVAVKVSRLIIVKSGGGTYNADEHPEYEPPALTPSAATSPLRRGTPPLWKRFTTRQGVP